MSEQYPMSEQTKNDQPPPGQYGAPPPGQYGAPPQGQYGAPPPGYGAPPSGQYGAPPPGQYGAPPHGQYGAPPPGQYGAPPPGQYGAPPPGQYGAPPPGQYGAPPSGQYGAQPPPPGQPAQGQWMQAPQGITGCPPGLEYLAHIDQLVIKQQMEILELVTGWESANKYRVFNNVGQQVYFAAEESDVCQRQCCGPARGFIVHLTDNFGNEVLRVTREFKCCAGCCWCAESDACAFEVKVEAPVGQVVGFIRQEASSWAPSYTIRSTDRDVVGYIEVPCCVCNSPWCGDVEFPIKGKDNTTDIGKIAKQWTGTLAEFFTDADTFSVTFPMDMDVKLKAVFIGAIFLIDFMYFEQQQNNNNH